VKRRTLVRAVAVIVCALLVAFLCLAIYLRFADLSGWRDTVAEKVSQSLGRKVTIAGEFKPAIGLTTRLTVGDVTLANPDWSGEPTMASVRQLTVELGLLSLVSGPLTFHDIEIEGARILLEQDADGRANWDFGSGKKSTPSKGPLELVLQHVVLSDVQLTYLEPSRSAPLEARIEHFETTEDHAGMLQITFDGAVDHRDVTIAGRAGTLAGLFCMALGFYAVDPDTFASPAFQLFSGASMLGAFFIATDPVSASTTPRGRLIYGAGIGIITSVNNIHGYPV